MSSGASECSPASRGETSKANQTDKTTQISKELFIYRFFSRIQTLNYPCEWGIFLVLLAQLCSPFHPNSSRSSCSGPHLALPLAQWLAQSTWGCSVGRRSNWLQSLLTKSNSTPLCSFLHSKIPLSYSPSNQLDFFFHGPIWEKLLLHSHNLQIWHIPFQPCSFPTLNTKREVTKCCPLQLPHSSFSLDMNAINSAFLEEASTRGAINLHHLPRLMCFRHTGLKVLGEFGRTWFQYC